MSAEFPGSPDWHADDSPEELDPPTPGVSPDAQDEGLLESCHREEDETAETVSELEDGDVQNRLWIRALVPLLQLRSQETDASGRVQFAFDLMHIAACERVARILRSDLLPDRG